MNICIGSWLEKLIRGGLVGADEAGSLVIERLEEQGEATPVPLNRNQEDQRQGISSRDFRLQTSDFLHGLSALSID